MSAVFGADTVEADDSSSSVVGRQLYRDGIRPSGKPLTAIVIGDTPLLGKQFSCDSCHGRSGMGTTEGNYVVPAITGDFLFKASSNSSRPVYNQQSLARVLRSGIDPAGRTLNPLMPRYEFSDHEVALLANYLIDLSTTQPTGIDDKVIRFATVVTDDVDIDIRNAMIEVLKTYVDEKNRQTRLESQRPNRGLKPEARLPSLYREWALDVWTLKGDNDGWQQQLENLYKNKPVFALLSGISSDSWTPVGRFCEEHEIPCLFPSTDFPNAEEANFYSLYFSKGLELEAGLIATHLDANPVEKVIQIHCSFKSSLAANVLRSTLIQKNLLVDDIKFNCEDNIPIAEINSRIDTSSNAAIILWLSKDKLASIKLPATSNRIYLSSTLLKRDPVGVFPLVENGVFVAHPYRLPNATDSALGRFKIWARTRKIDVQYPRLQAEAFFACFAVNDALFHTRRFRSRDYLLEMLDHSEGLALYLPVHARPGIGPNQRFFTKGGYLLPLSKGNPLNKKATWLFP